MYRPSPAATTPTWIIEHLSERDQKIMGLVGQFKLVSALQIERLYFADMKTKATGARLCRRTLERLTEQKVLMRLKRRIGGIRAGSASYIYALGPIGQHIDTSYKARRYSREPSDTFIDHTLAITEIYVRLCESTILLTDVEAEPECWRPYGFTYGGNETLKPDLFVKFVRDDDEFSWFIEVDRATEHREAITRKLKTYLAYFNVGGEQAKHGVFPRVLWSVPDQKRKLWLDQLAAPFNKQVEGLFTIAVGSDAPEILRDEEPP